MKGMETTVMTRKKLAKCALFSVWIVSPDMAYEKKNSGIPNITEPEREKRNAPEA